MVRRRHTKPGALACLSQIKTLITTVRSLFTTPVTVNAVADMAFRQAKPKKLMANPNTHDNETAITETVVCPFRKEASAISRYSPMATQKKGESMSDSRLLYSTKPQVLSPRSVTMCLMYTISVQMVTRYAAAHVYAVTVNVESVITYPTAPARITSSDPNVYTDGSACPRNRESASATSSGVDDRNTMKVSTLACLSRFVLVKIAR